MTPEELRTLTLFNTVESSPEINQRQLARELDVSLGLTNTYFQRVLKKGWIRAQQVKPRRWLYFLMLWAFENVMAAAHLEHLQRDDEALEWWKKSASHPNAGFWAFAGLAASHSLLGQQEEAESSLAKVLELNPDLSQSYLDATYPGVLLRFKKGLALAGLS